jgi:hypothetical protein
MQGSVCVCVSSALHAPVVLYHSLFEASCAAYCAVQAVQSTQAAQSVRITTLPAKSSAPPPAPSSHLEEALQLERQVGVVDIVLPRKSSTARLGPKTKARVTHLRHGLSCVRDPSAIAHGTPPPCAEPPSARIARRISHQESH